MSISLLVLALDMIQVGVNIVRIDSSQCVHPRIDGITKFLFSKSKAVIADLPFVGCISVLSLSNGLRNKYVALTLNSPSD